ncbi:transglutaminase N-terminal domain-containing protein, partial [Enterococcus faecium]|uniref:transglutaminase N-terminal domain-containing protein n=1 Tax=Enterococcus faecium TaxID=1352 RepID=UPI003F43A151
VGLFHLMPRELPWQRVTAASVTLDPVPGDISPDIDYFGNPSTYFHLTEPHEALAIEAASDVSVEQPTYDETALALPWERARPIVHP